MSDAILPMLVPAVILIAVLAVLIVALSARNARAPASDALPAPPVPPPPVPPSGDRAADEVIDHFERFGYVTTRAREELDIITAYAASVRVPTWTIVDEETGAVTVQKRAWGTLEGLG